jgi:gluconolactonase
VISPDGKTLYVSDHSGDPKGGEGRALVAYPLKDDGTLGARKVLYNFGKERGIDGMTVTKDGVVVATAGRGDAGGVWFFSPEGKKLAFLKTPEDPTNCCFAGDDKKTLYITAGKSLYRVKMTVAGK